MAADTQTDTIAPPWQGYCRSCGYLLRGLTASRCPECGQAFDRGNPKTYRKKPKRPLRAWLVRAAVLLLLLATAYAGEIGWLYWGWKAEQPAVALTDPFNVIGRPLGPAWLAKTVRPRDRWLLQRVSRLYIDYKVLSDGDMAMLGRLGHLETLWTYGIPVTDQGLAHLADLRQLKTLCFRSRGITDAGLVHLKGMRRLEELTLSYTSVTGSGLVHLREMPNLRMLNLSGTPLHPKRFDELQRLPALTNLLLRDTPTDDAALEHLASLPKLNILDLSHTKITDRGLNTLAHMKGLKLLNLEENAISQQAVAELQKALPQTTLNAAHLLTPADSPPAPPK